jgi:hypothetical protein
MCVCVYALVCVHASVTVFLVAQENARTRPNHPTCTRDVGAAVGIIPSDHNCSYVPRTDVINGLHRIGFELISKEKQTLKSCTLLYLDTITLKAHYPIFHTTRARRQCTVTEGNDVIAVTRQLIRLHHLLL